MDREGSILLSLVRSSLWHGETVPDIDPGATRDIDWGKVFDMSVRQQVTALAFEGLQNIPGNPDIPPSLLFRWAAQAEGVAVNYRRHKEALGKLAKLLGDEGIKILLLKGIGTARYYPVPENRQSTDLDVWFFGNYERANQIIASRGIKIDREDSGKHSVFGFMGVGVENHSTFLDVESFGIDRTLEKELLDILESDECEAFEPTGEDDGSRVFFPPAGFDALFLARHASQHFVRDMTLRQACDWARFLHCRWNETDPDKILRILKQNGQEIFAGAMTDICVRHLGLSAGFAGTFATPRPGLSNKVLEDILYPRVFEQPPAGGIFGRYLVKYRRFRATQWKYRMVYGRSAASRTAEILADKRRRKNRSRRKW